MKNINFVCMCMSMCMFLKVETALVVLNKVNIRSLLYVKAIKLLYIYPCIIKLNNSNK